MCLLVLLEKKVFGTFHWLSNLVVLPLNIGFFCLVTAMRLMLMKLGILTKVMMRSSSLSKEKRDVFGTSALAVWKVEEKMLQ